MLAQLSGRIRMLINVIDSQAVSRNKVTASDLFPGPAIFCTDAAPPTWNKTSFIDHLHQAQEISPNIGDIWAAIPLPCQSYGIRAEYRFEGPFTGNTSHPILWVGNTADPVTPVESAYKASKGFPGSVVLTQNSPGHCSLNAYSFCTFIHIKQYFQTGELPAEGTVCEIDQLPFGPSPGEVEVLSEEVNLQIESYESMAGHLYAAGGGLMSSRFAKVHFSEHNMVL